MKPSVHSPCGIPASGTVSAQLFHIILVFCATGLMMVIAIFALISAFLLRLIDPTPMSRRAGWWRHATFLLEPKITITPQPHSASSTPQPSLSLTKTQRELEPSTTDVAEDPLRVLTRICDFLACNTARARKRGEFDTTPPLAGLGLYLDAMRVDLAHIDEMVQGGKQEAQRSNERGDRKEDVPRAGVDAVAGVGADTNAHDEPGLVVPPHQTTHVNPFLTSLSQFPTTLSPVSPHDPSSSTSSSVILRTVLPITDTEYPPCPTILTTATTATSTPRKRKDAVFRVPKKVSDPDHADADSAAVRAAAVLARFADLGAGLEGTVRERGAAFITKMII